MTGRSLRAFVSIHLKASFVALCCAGLAYGDPIPLTVPKATCGPNDHPETALQGQVPAAMRAAGFKGFNCNLELIGQVRGDGANWQTTQFVEGNRRCAYYGT